ncbi:class I SAM-dependent methyltransferase [Streptomyces sp. NPDC004726]
MPGPRGPGGPPTAERVLVPSAVAGGQRVVLDAGFGDGRLRSQILAGGLSWVGADIDPARVAAARAAGFPAVCCDLTRSLPFRTGSVDGVVLVFVLNVIPRRSRRSRLAAEIRRVLKPGGVVWIRDFQRVDDPGDGRIGGEVGQAEWSAANRRHRWGRRLAAELAGVPARDLLPGSFPAFRVAPGFAGTDRFVNHRYSVRQFRRAVARRQVTFDFVACHSTADELRNEWGRIGVVEEVVRTVGQARGGTKLPALDLLVRM